EIMLGWQPGSHTVVSVVRNLRATVWAHSLDDGNERPLTPDSLRVTGFNVSDDGRQLAYAVHRGGGIRDLLVAPLDGSEPPRTRGRRQCSGTAVVP
ncbi:MAG TPA: hypothetical protein PLL69_04525, partial [Gemmatimonadales bacterium]|nr:hypothetical protein [Gemmatimonadales bacterium]